jgi:hypothetical protein
LLTADLNIHKHVTSIIRSFKKKIMLVIRSVDLCIPSILLAISMASEPRTHSAVRDESVDNH